jgi:hypothetical protein
MKSIVAKIMIVVVAMTASIECSNSVLDELPTSIAQFVTRYFPGVAVSDYSDVGGIYNVKIRNGAALSFNGEYDWISVNGDGSTLPQMLLFDQLPPALFEYLQGAEQLSGVYGITRNATTYSATLLDATVYYDRDSGRVTQYWTSGY